MGYSQRCGIYSDGVYTARGYIKRWDIDSYGVYTAMGHIQRWDIDSYGVYTAMGYRQRWVYTAMGYVQRWGIYNDGVYTAMGYIHGRHMNLPTHPNLLAKLQDIKSSHLPPLQTCALATRCVNIKSR